MATTVGRSAEAAVKAGIFAALNVAALTTALGYPVKVYGTVPQTFTYPVEGYTVVHVNYDGSQAGDPSDEVGVRIFHRTVMVTVTVEEV
jgi:hypothetical protein